MNNVPNDFIRKRKDPPDCDPNNPVLKNQCAEPCVKVSVQDYQNGTNAKILTYKIKSLIKTLIPGEKDPSIRTMNIEFKDGYWIGKLPLGTGGTVDVVLQPNLSPIQNTTYSQRLAPIQHPTYSQQQQRQNTYTQPSMPIQSGTTISNANTSQSLFDSVKEGDWFEADIPKEAIKREKTSINNYVDINLQGDPTEKIYGIIFYIFPERPQKKKICYILIYKDTNDNAYLTAYKKGKENMYTYTPPEEDDATDRSITITPDSLTSHNLKNLRLLDTANDEKLIENLKKAFEKDLPFNIEMFNHIDDAIEMSFLPEAKLDNVFTITGFGRYKENIKKSQEKRKSLAEYLNKKELGRFRGGGKLKRKKIKTSKRKKSNRRKSRKTRVLT